MSRWQIERAVERLRDQVDKQMAEGTLSQSEYDEKMRAIDREEHEEMEGRMQEEIEDVYDSYGH